MAMRWEYQEIAIPFSVRSTPRTNEWCQMFAQINSAVTNALQRYGAEGWTADCDPDAQALLSNGRIASREHTSMFGIGQSSFTYGPITVRLKRTVR
jgi:hypothetical protein